MEFEELEKKAIETLKERIAKKEIETNVDLTMTHLMEEIGEIAVQINHKKLKRKEQDINNLGEEISDSIILLMYLAYQHGINLEQSMLNKIEEIKNK